MPGTGGISTNIILRANIFFYLEMMDQEQDWGTDTPEDIKTSAQLI